MPHRAFVPAPLLEAQPRVYRAFRGRQLKGLIAAGLGASLVAVTLGMQDFHAYVLTFAAALPGFLYGYYQPQGRPIEFWLMVHYRYLAAPQVWSAAPGTGRFERLGETIRAASKAIRYVTVRSLLDRRGNGADE